jgi:hypothetical protein
MTLFPVTRLINYLTFSKGCGDYGKKDYTSDDVKMIKSTGYFVKANLPYDSMWILPPDM